MLHKDSWRLLFLKVLAGAALFAVANVFVYQSNQYFQRESEYHDEVSGFFERPAVTALFVGDSHVAQLDNELLPDDLYNVAWGGDSLREVYAKLRYLLWRGCAIRTLYLTADPHMFGADRLQSTNRAFVDPYLLVTRSRYGLEQGWPAAVLNSIPLFNDDFVQYLKKRIALSLHRNDEGMRHLDEVAWSNLTEEERARRARQDGIADHLGIGDYAAPFLWYERIVTLAREHDIRVVTIEYPVHAAYAAAASASAEQRVRAELRRLGVPLLDFHAAFTDPSYFSDPDHVSRKGAIALLQQLSERTGRPCWPAECMWSRDPTMVNAPTRRNFVTSHPERSMNLCASYARRQPRCIMLRGRRRHRHRSCQIQLAIAGAFRFHTSDRCAGVLVKKRATRLLRAARCARRIRAGEVGEFNKGARWRATNMHAGATLPTSHQNRCCKPRLLTSMRHRMHHRCAAAHGHRPC
jgi:hypothetical protein